MKDPTKDTPLMRQYWEIKAQHQDKILFFRMGDFYEMFFDDAVKAAPLLGIALTMRNKKAQNETPMCGIPHHAVSGPINRLLSLGHKVALCDQIEDPKLAKGIVKRAVTRVLTPGMVLDPESLDASEQNLIACFEDSSLAAVDPSTGEAFYYEGLNLSEVQSLAGILKIVEWLQAGAETLSGALGPIAGLVTHFDISREDLLASAKDLGSGEGDSLESSANQLSLFSEHLPLAALRLQKYVQSMGTTLEFRWKRKNFHRYLHLSAQVQRQLELFKNYQGEERGSFFAALDRTQTAPGKRLLKDWIRFPLLDQEELGCRQRDLIKLQGLGLFELRRLQKLLNPIGDLERRLSKASGPGGNARDLLNLAHSILAGKAFIKELSFLSVKDQVSAEAVSVHLFEQAERVLTHLVEEPPLNIKQGYLLKSGVSSELDELMVLTQESSRLLEELENRERQATGISSLKIRYNQVFGYYIEVTHTHKDKIPDHYQRKQTLANAERFCTDELLELERKILSAADKRGHLEYQIFNELKDSLCRQRFEILLLARECAYWDILIGFNELAIERNWTLPVLSPEPVLDLQLSRHPVLEQLSSDFVANDIVLQNGECLCLTGPNMAGKSTLMRQCALTVLMHQMGCFVPAAKARLGLVDRILTRIGLSDVLSEGLSTFMVEMTETAHLLNTMTPRSLLIIDEVGRGTATYDGMSLAQAILEFILQRKQGLTFFATHYHELTKLEERFVSLKNAHLAISDLDGQTSSVTMGTSSKSAFRFLYQLVGGPAGKSYGVEVAKLAGLPDSVCQRATYLLQHLEKSDASVPVLSGLGQQDLFKKEFVEPKPSIIKPKVSLELESLVQQLLELDLMGQSPLESLMKVQSLQIRIKQIKDQNIHV